MRKMSSHFSSLLTIAVEAELPQQEKIGVSIENASAAHDDQIVDERFIPLEMSLEDELDEGGDEAMKYFREKQRELINALPLDEWVTSSSISQISIC
jgi:N-acetyltransferase 10